jgi:hypothetical protein
MNALTVPGLPAHVLAGLRYEGECIIPRQKPFRDGYVRFRTAGKMHAAHRTVAVAVLGPPPFPGAVVDHIVCDNRRCCNPEHLTWSTAKANVLRGIGPTAVNARKTHCVSGHLFDEENTGWRDTPVGRRRHCRACHRRRTRERAARQRAAAHQHSP